MRQSYLGVGALVALLCGIVAFRYQEHETSVTDQDDATTEEFESDILQMKSLRSHTTVKDIDVAKMCSNGWASENSMIELRGDSSNSNCLRWFHGLQGLYVVDKAVSNADMREITSLGMLEILRFHNCHFADDFDWSMLSATALRYVGVSGNGIREEQVHTLIHSLPNSVVCLVLSDSPLTDELVADLKRLIGLEFVDISHNTKLTDKGFEALCELDSVKVIKVAELSTRISRKAKQDAKKKKPNLRLDEV